MQKFQKYFAEKQLISELLVYKKFTEFLFLMQMTIKKSTLY